MVDSFFLSLHGPSEAALGIIASNALWFVIGVIAGMFFGVIPGMGGVVTLSIILPFTLRMDPFAAFILLAAALGATSFSGSISAILVNAPGTGGNAATLLDGYPMTKKGEGAKAIGASSLASAAGAVVGLGAFLIMIPFVVEIALLFGPSEIFWLVIFGLAIIPLVAGEQILAGLAMAGLGILFSFVGQTPVTGEYRFTYDLPFLFDGLGLIPPLVGLFAFAEMFRLASTKSQIVESDADTEMDIGGKWEGIREVIRHRWLWFRSSLIGLLVGIIPGVGAVVATFISYGQAMQSSDEPEKFGTGVIEGVIATESANDSKDGGQLFPTLGLGIPGSATMAVLLGGFLIHGIQPGPRLLVDELELMLVIVYSLVASNIATSIIGVVFTEVFTKITRVSISRLFPSIIVLSLIAVFVLRNNYSDVLLAILFGVIGITLMSLNINRVPIIIALILGEMAETNYHLSIRLSDGGVFTALFTGWLNQLLIAILLVSVVASAYRHFATERDETVGTP